MAESSKKLKIALKKIKSDGTITVFFPQLGEDLILQVWTIWVFSGLRMGGPGLKRTQVYPKGYGKRIHQLYKMQKAWLCRLSIQDGCVHLCLFSVLAGEPLLSQDHGALRLLSMVKVTWCLLKQSKKTIIVWDFAMTLSLGCQTVPGTYRNNPSCSSGQACWGMAEGTFGKAEKLYREGQRDRSVCALWAPVSFESELIGGLGSCCTPHDGVLELPWHHHDVKNKLNTYLISDFRIYKAHNASNRVYVLSLYCWEIDLYIFLVNW